MLGLAAVALLLVVLLASLLAYPTLRRGYRIPAAALVLAYGAACLVTLAHSYFHTRSALDRFAARQEAATEHLRQALSRLPDSLRTRPVIWEAQRLQERLAEYAEHFGPRVWGVRWVYGVFPVFDGKRLAANMNLLVDTPPLLVYGAGEEARQTTRCSEYYLLREMDYLMHMSRTVAFVDHLLQNCLEIQRTAAELCKTIDLNEDDADDPRGRTYRLATLGRQLIATLSKVKETADAGYGAFDELLFLRVRRAYASEETSAGEWQPCSPFFLDLAELAASFKGVNALKVRWAGDPQVPQLGSDEAVYRLECEVRGTWPAGQGRWTDAKTGESGPVYYVSGTTARYYGEGVRISKWPRQPEFRAVGIVATGPDEGLAGLPLIRVDEDLFWPEAPANRR